MLCTKVKRNQRRILESFLQLLSLELSPVTEAKVSATEKGELPTVTISQQDHKAGSAEEYSFLSDTLSLAWPLCTQSCKLGQAWVSCVRIYVHACACTCMCMYVLCIHRSLRLVLGVSLYRYIFSETRWPGDYQLSKTIGPASPGPACLPTPRARFTGVYHCVSFLCGCQGENPGPQACAANTLLSEPSAQPHAWGFKLGFCHSHQVYVLKTQIPCPICSCKAKEGSVG